MTRRERTLWTALLGNLLVWGGYFAWLASRVAEGGMAAGPGPAALVDVIVWLVIWSAVTAAVAELVAGPGHSDDGPDDTLDERERAVRAEAGAGAYTLLTSGALIVVGGMVMGWPSGLSINALLFACILAETVRYAVEIRALRV